MTEHDSIILKINKLTVGYPNKVLIKEATLSAQKGELIALMGLNGTGKTSFFKTLLNEISAVSGSILYQNEKLETIDSLQRLVSIVFTDRVSVFGFTVRDMVNMGRMPYTNLFGKLTKEDKAIVKTQIEQLDLTDIADKEINELSDGQFQKVMIARALAQETPLILLDEPTAFLDIKNKKIIHSLLTDLTEKENKTVIVSTHSLSFATKYCNKIWLVEDETIKELRPTEITEERFMPI